jgi:hypothetical protein
VYAEWLPPAAQAALRLLQDVLERPVLVLCGLAHPDGLLVLVAVELFLQAVAVLWCQLEGRSQFAALFVFVCALSSCGLSLLAVAVAEAFAVPCLYSKPLLYSLSYSKHQQDSTH